ncbi:SGNH hydrolase [Rhizodiscina lignyota]|uniref:SGNH hydrolase n=1 Tax=Rhizodiscina lignyota TaxID=1504668 RepID=A0A9P4MDH3_9PEZI|nr:SGNH hydrolase [Rhizodiscina lignyota]
MAYGMRAATKHITYFLLITSIFLLIRQVALKHSSVSQIPPGTLPEMPLHIASLGSSFAAGPCIKPQLPPKAAGRSAANYAQLLASKLDARLTDLSVSGATLLNLLDEPQVATGWINGGHTFAPQVQDLPSDVDIVLVLGGGNDIGYISGMGMDIVKNSWPIRMVDTVRQFVFGASTPKPALSFDDLVARYGKVLDAIHAKSPKAKIVVVEYLTLLGDDVKPRVDVTFDAERVEHHKEVAAMLQRATEKAASERNGWCERVPVAENSLLHGLGSEEPWTEGLSLGILIRGDAPLHPNAKGMVAVANMLYEKLQGYDTKDSQ